MSSTKCANRQVGFGLNALTEEYVDLVKAGVVDPVKVTRSALENAASIASLILTTEVVATEIKEKAPAGGGGDTAAAAWAECINQLA